MQVKPFAIGLRIEHPTEMINLSQYGNSEDASLLSAADYKLTYQTSLGRAVYSFCMCPGGHIINASSERGHIAVNGMSYHARDAVNSNSALVVNITPEDCFAYSKSKSVLSGVEFQRHWENAAYRCGNGAVPLQLLADFTENRESKGLGAVIPDIKGQFQLSNLRECLPNYVSSAIIEGIAEFQKHIRGFDRKDAILCGIESRTSSPVKILRDASLQSNISGIFPCGEGAGYAGGITSAAVDGIKVAEAIAAQYKVK